MPTRISDMPQKRQILTSRGQDLAKAMTPRLASGSTKRVLRAATTKVKIGDNLHTITKNQYTHLLQQ